MKKAILGGFLLVTAMALAGCQDESIKDFGPKAERPLPDKLVQSMKAKGMTKYSPVMFRIFKEEGTFEVWKRKDTGRYELVTTYDICKISGELGPKFTEGDRQAPEGFYPIRPYQMNPKSSYYLSFDTGFPNAFDRSHGRTGANLMVHGACSSSGCYSMSDEQVAQIYAFARDAFRGGQTEIQLEAFPFRMTAANMARYRNDPNFGFWQMLKEGYDHFEITKVPPKVDVCERRYVFNRVAGEGQSFKASEPCPAAVQSDAIRVAYSAREASEKSAFDAALSQNLPPPAPSIAGIKEANLVSAWSKARSAGKKVSRLPPSFETAEKQMAEEQVRKSLAAAPVPEPKPAETPAADPAGATADSNDAATTEPAKKKWWKVFGS